MSGKPTHGRARPAAGAALPVLLVLLAAGMALSAAVAGTAALELAMSERSTGGLRAFEAAEAGLAETLKAAGWSAVTPWTAAGVLPEGGAWQAEVRLFAARVDPLNGTVQWHFEIESTGQNGAARATLLQGFEVVGPLPGSPKLRWWRHQESAP